MTMETRNKQIKKIIKTFAPKIRLKEAKNITETFTKLESDAFYTIIDDFVSNLEPSFKDKYETKWEYVYLPLKRKGKLICSHVSVFLSYKKAYYLTFYGFDRGRGGISVNKGEREIPEGYALIIDEIKRLMPAVQTYKDELLDKIFPYKWRGGQIKRLYTRNKSDLIPKEEGDKILADYKKMQEKNLTLTEISLNNYMETAEICYRAAFADRIEEMLRRKEIPDDSIKILHQVWADNRHGGMLFVKDADSKKEYMDWYFSNKWDGAHPFEIVYSGSVHGIYLYPPDKKDLHYRVSVVDSDYNKDFLAMVVSLIENNIPFATYGLEDIVDFCVGEAYIDVNSTSMRMDESLTYRHKKEEKKKYFSLIKWNKHQMAKLNVT